VTKLTKFQLVQLAAAALVVAALMSAARERLRSERTECRLEATIVAHCEERKRWAERRNR
jgi:hypothetical protein